MSVEEIFQELFERYQVLEQCRDDIWKAYKILEKCYENQGKLLVAGNGGSASDSEHIVGELMKGFIKPRNVTDDFRNKLCGIDSSLGNEIADGLQGAMPAIALVNHVALSTAFLNDVDPILAFAQQLNGYGNANDVFLGISTSGNSKNIVYACIVAKAKGIPVIGLTGKNGGKLKDLADATIIVPEEETFKIQELHLPVYHALCLMLEERFF